MSLTQIKKSMNKADQFLREKVGGAWQTQLGEEFEEMNKKCSIMGELLEDIPTKTKEYLQPNPAARAKINALSTYQKIKGQESSALYPQAEEILGSAMVKYGESMGSSFSLGSVLTEFGDAMKHMSELKFALENSAKQNFLDPFKTIHEKEFKEFLNALKKMHGRRLDYDGKKRKKTSDAELHEAEAKFIESKSLVVNSMQALLGNEVEIISELSSFAECLQEYHNNCAEVLKGMLNLLQDKKEESVVNRDKRKEMMSAILGPNLIPSSPPSNDHNNNASKQGSRSEDAKVVDANSVFFDAISLTSSSTEKSSACAKALYDFEAINPGEVEFKENEIITLTREIDEHWYEGFIKSEERKGIFPKNYVEVIVPLD